MQAQSYTVAFEGVEAQLVEVQCAVSAGAPMFAIVGLPDKSVSEARSRVRSALQALSIALPAKRITINLAPADLPKEGSHFDLPIAVAVLAALGVIPKESAAGCLALGELALDGRILPVSGALPAALTAAQEEQILLCPKENAPEAAWVSQAQVMGAANLSQVLQHFNGSRPLSCVTPREIPAQKFDRDMKEVKGHERAKRALEIAAAGRHHLLFIGAPGSGKSMLASRLPTIMPPLEPAEALETSIVHSIAGLSTGGLSRQRPYRDPHHTASVAAMVGGGRLAKPGEVSLAHNGVLFLDELPEYSRQVLETLRQPLETNEITIARANAHLRYPCRFLLVAAANPCRCGYLPDPARACAKVPLCGDDYLGKISGPLMDRFDLRLEIPPVFLQDLDLPASGETSAQIAARVAKARAIQSARFKETGRTNADLSGQSLEKYATPNAEGRALVNRLAEKMGLSARGYHRVLRVARTIADLAASEEVKAPHIAEAFSYRLTSKRQA